MINSLIATKQMVNGDVEKKKTQKEKRRKREQVEKFSDSSKSGRNC